MPVRKSGRRAAPSSEPQCGPPLAFKGIAGNSNSMRMKQSTLKWTALSGLFIGFGALLAQNGNLVSSYTPVDIHESFSAVFSRMRHHTVVLEQPSDSTDLSAQGITMSPGRPPLQCVRVKPPTRVTWDQLADMSPDQINELGQFPDGFEPLPHPHHPKAVSSSRVLRSMN